MKHKTFFWFFLPTGLAMFLFIALPIVSVVIQSVYAPHEAVIIEVENCGPFGCTTETTIDQAATAAIREAEPLGRFVGLDIYLDRAHLAVAEVAEAWKTTESFGEFRDVLFNLPFYRALAFTLTYTFVCTPLLIILGLMIALAVNSLHRRLKGLAIFFSLLPMIVTPLIGSLILFWMIDSRGILGNLIAYLANDPGLSLKASTPLMWISLIVYGIWSSAPFAFVVFYAGLQTLPQDQIEAAQIDGASRWEQVRYVVIPHLMPLVTFVALIQIMDNFKVLEPIIGFQASAHATSLSWIIVNDLGGETRQLSAAATTSVMTILGVAILLSPVLVRTWRDFKARGH
jgi:ABC-type sugar transport system permease subunit